MIPVTKSFIPPINEYTSIVNRAFTKEWLTNRGELTLELERKLMEYLDVSNIIIMNNGTIPIQIALKLLGNYGEIITTPFSYIATTSSILWEKCKPVFVDIHPEFFTIDEFKIEAAITKKTTAILATHVFGNPCNIEVINNIAKKYNLKVIYDAAHCFGVKYFDKSIFKYGDISTCSFHATKLFHTGEGGAAFCNDDSLRAKIFYSHNFGHNGPLDYYGLGINGKISELQSAMGLAVLPYLDSIIAYRKKIIDFYLNNLDFSKYKSIKIRENTTWNYSYFPILFRSENILLDVQYKLNTNNIFPRRYFYPSLNKINYVHGTKMIISEDISSRIMCLPVYYGLSDSEVENIVNLLNE